MTFFLSGKCGDPGYRNTRDHPCGRVHKEFVETLWKRFQHLADQHFREDARNHFLQRFWEMYLAVALMDHGFDIKRYGGHGPDYYTDTPDGRIWFEAVAPTSGTGPDQVPQVVPGVASRVPTEKMLLRFTNALIEKKKKYDVAREKKIVSDSDAYVLAINSRGIREAPEKPLPYYVQAFLPIGQFSVLFDRSSGRAADSFYQYRQDVRKENGATVSTSAFLNESSSFCSAVLHSSASSADYANYPDSMGSDFSILFNPSAAQPLKNDLFAWCERFEIKNDALVRKRPTNQCCPECYR